MSLESRNALYQRILHIGLAYPIPERPLNPSDDPDAEHQREIYNLYASGQITVPQYHHLKDREYEEVHGIQSKRRVGKMTVDETGVIDAFVEDEPGEREARLREQIEGVVTPLDQLEEGLLDKNGKEIMLHPMDRRAIEFRERMRTW